ncbi:HopJ type III effector protein [Methylococcus capsulatus]|uniref:HopJ type III effector protein n=1 Tax=Methylococcus capsulatus TaxID=414 RepID=UPI00030A7A60|nr:HopJ type III effector protein [Methylococcus capsulatus]QXP90751.1 HopJ type III effector protein [Methylococcus capsulatus]
MTPEELIARIRQGDRIAFTDTVEAIDSAYHFTPTEFRNGRGDDVVINPAGTNSGSCKIFGFARLHRLSVTETLALFGDYYWEDVLGRPDGDDHRNIRTFMKYGWEGISFPESPLAPR